MAKVKKGDLFSCAACGLIISVDEACGCAATELICCGKTMVKGKAAAAKVRKSPPMSNVKAIKPAPARKAVKAAPKKPAVKKPAAKPATKKPAPAKSKTAKKK